MSAPAADPPPGPSPSPTTLPTPLPPFPLRARPVSVPWYELEEAVLAAFFGPFGTVTSEGVRLPQSEGETATLLYQEPEGPWRAWRDRMQMQEAFELEEPSFPRPLSLGGPVAPPTLPVSQPQGEEEKTSLSSSSSPPNPQSPPASLVSVIAPGGPAARPVAVQGEAEGVPSSQASSTSSSSLPANGALSDAEEVRRAWSLLHNGAPAPEEEKWLLMGQHTFTSSLAQMEAVEALLREKLKQLEVRLRLENDATRVKLLVGTAQQLPSSGLARFTVHACALDDSALSLALSQLKEMRPCEHTMLLTQQHKQRYAALKSALLSQERLLLHQHIAVIGEGPLILVALSESDLQASEQHILFHLSRESGSTLPLNTELCVARLNPSDAPSECEVAFQSDLLASTVLQRVKEAQAAPLAEIQANGPLCTWSSSAGVNTWRTLRHIYLHAKPLRSVCTLSSLSLKELVTRLKKAKVEQEPLYSITGVAPLADEQDDIRSMLVLLEDTAVPGSGKAVQQLLQAAQGEASLPSTPAPSPPTPNPTPAASLSAATRSKAPSKVLPLQGAPMPKAITLVKLVKEAFGLKCWADEEKKTLTIFGAGPQLQKAVQYAERVLAGKMRAEALESLTEKMAPPVATWLFYARWEELQRSAEHLQVSLLFELHRAFRGGTEPVRSKPPADCDPLLITARGVCLQGPRSGVQSMKKKIEAMQRTDVHCVEQAVAIRFSASFKPTLRQAYMRAFTFLAGLLREEVLQESHGTIGVWLEDEEAHKDRKKKEEKVASVQGEADGLAAASFSAASSSSNAPSYPWQVSSTSPKWQELVRTQSALHAARLSSPELDVKEHHRNLTLALEGFIKHVLLSNGCTQPPRGLALLWWEASKLIPKGALSSPQARQLKKLENCMHRVRTMRNNVHHGVCAPNESALSDIEEAINSMEKMFIYAEQGEENKEDKEEKEKVQEDSRIDQGRGPPLNTSPAVHAPPLWISVYASSSDLARTTLQRFQQLSVALRHEVKIVDRLQFQELKGSKNTSVKSAWHAKASKAAALPAFDPMAFQRETHCSLDFGDPLPGKPDELRLILLGESDNLSAALQALEDSLNQRAVQTQPLYAPPSLPFGRFKALLRGHLRKELIDLCKLECVRLLLDNLPPKAVLAVRGVAHRVEAAMDAICKHVQQLADALHSSTLQVQRGFRAVLNEKVREMQTNRKLLKDVVSIEYKSSKEEAEEAKTEIHKHTYKWKYTNTPAASVQPTSDQGTSVSSGIRGLGQRLSSLLYTSTSSTPSSSSSSVPSSLTLHVVRSRVDVLDPRLGCDCVVNAANSQLSHVGGLARAIADKAGTEWEQQNRAWVRQNGPLPVGYAMAIAGGKQLAAQGIRTVVNAVSPRWVDGRQGEDEALFQCALRALLTAEQAGCSKVALTVLGSGVFGVPKDVSVRCILAAVCVFVGMQETQQKRTIKAITLCDSDLGTATLLGQLAEKLLPTTGMDAKAALQSLLSPLSSLHHLLQADSSSSAASPQSIEKQWYWDLENDPVKPEIADVLVEGRWVPYDAAQNHQIESCRQAGQMLISPLTGDVLTKQNGHKYEVDLKKMIQRNLTHANHRERAIQCRPLPQVKKAAKPKRATDTSFPELQAAMERVFKQGWQAGGKAAAGGSSASSSSATSSSSSPSASLPVTVYGHSQADVSATVQALRALERASLKKQVIPQSVSKRHAQDELRAAIQEELAGMEVQWQLDSSSGDVLLSGFGSELTEAHSRVLQLLLRLRTDLYPLPSHWSSREQEDSHLHLEPLPLDSEEVLNIQQRMQKTMPSARLLRVQRVENKLLWRDFAHHIQKLKDSKGGAEPTVLSLFHGTRSTDPQLIYNGQMGFDFRFAKQGQWGYGVYFASDASYSHHYASHTSGSERTLFLAQVLVGDAHDCGTTPQPDLKTPPAKPTQSGGIAFANELYDSVKCNHQGSNNYIVYEGGRAYPTYIITYRA